jgi:hypothetical protein
VFGEFKYCACICDTCGEGAVTTGNGDCAQVEFGRSNSEEDGECIVNPGVGVEQDTK